MGQTELPGTTQPGGPGFLSITTQQLDDGVQGVSYTTTINTSGGSGRLTTCRLISGTLPTGFAAPVVSGSTCILTTNGQPVTGSAGKFTISIQAGDSSTPQRTDQRVYSLTIRPQFTINSPVILDGVAGRSYSRAFTVTTNLQNHGGASIIGSSEAGNGPATQCTIVGLPAAFAGAASCAPDASGVNVIVSMKAAPGTLASGTYPFTLSVTDSPIRSTNQTGVVSPASTTTITSTLVVRQEFAVTQGTIAEAVQGRTYGVSPLVQGVSTDVVAAAPPVNSGQPSEIGNGPLTSCVIAVAPADPGLTVTVDPKNPNRCLLESATPAPAAGTYLVTVSATDSPIVDPASPGSIVIPANTEEQQLTWVVAAPISYTLNFDSAQGQPGQAPPAVENRTYGTAPKSPLVLTATGGLSASDGLSIALSGSVPVGIVCATPQPNPQPPGLTAQLTCTSSGNPVSASPGTASFAVTVSDAGNTATPAGSIANDALGHTNHSLTVEAPLNLSANLPDPLPHGVSHRPYGIPPTQPLTYTASGGLSGYSFTTPLTIASPGAAFPQGIACAQGSGTGANTFACSASSITANGSTTAAYGPVPVTVDDTANPTTPDGASSSTTFTLDRTLAVEPPLSINAVAGIDPPPPGVQGRTYGSGSGFSPLAYVISGGDPPYTNFVLPPTVSSPALIGGSTPEGGVPAPISCANIVVGTTTEVVCSSAGAVSAAAGTYPFSFSVSDSGSGETAATSISLARMVTINPPLAWNGANPTSNSPPPGVEGRTYGGAGFTPLTYNATGGIPAYTFTLPPAAPSPGANSLPTNVACAASSGTQVVCTSGASAVSAAPGNYSFSITVNDTANATTPGSQASNTAATVTKPLVIEPQLALPLTSGTPAGAVDLRSYGTGTGCPSGAAACAPITYTISNGLGTYAMQASLAISYGFNCALPNSTSAVYQCSASPVSVSPAPASPTPETLTVTASDVANAATPAGSVTNNSTSVTVYPPFTLSAVITLAPPAVVGRTYGIGPTCGAGSNVACQTINYSVSGGFGNYQTPAPLTTANSSLGSLGMNCALNGGHTQYICSSPSISTSPIITSPTSTALTVTATDNGNASAPAATASDTSITNFTVNPPLAFALTSGTPATAVDQRAYGTGSGCTGGNCAPISFKVSGGLGSGNYASPATITPSNIGFGCPLQSGSTTYNCSASPVSVTPAPTAPTSEALTVTASDVANAATPAGSVTNSSTSVTVNPPFTLNAVTPVSWASTAVVGSSYGSAASGCTVSPCAKILYNVSGGLGPYQSMAAVTPTAPLTSLNLACSLVSTQYQCSIATLSAGPLSVLPTMPLPIAVTATDNNNASAPTQTATDSTVKLTVNPALEIAASPSSLPNGVTQRPYAVTGMNCGMSGTSTCTNLTFTASGGTGTPYTFPSSTPASFPSGFNCAASGAIYTCSANPAVTAASGSFSPSVTVTDAANASVISGTQTFTGSLTIQPALTFTTTAVTPAALVNYPNYASNTLAATGGLTPYSWVEPGNTSGGCTTKPTGSLPIGLSLGLATGILTGTATAPSTKDTDFTFQVCVTDTGNATTPPGSALPQTPGNDFTVHVFSRYAFIADPGANEVRVIDTGDSSNPPANSSLAAKPSGLQGSIAVAPDGLYALALLSGSSGIAVIDTITGNAASFSPVTLPSGDTCTNAKGIVTSGASAYLLCDNGASASDVYVLPLASLSSSTITPSSTIALGASTSPVALAISSDGKTLVVAEATATPALQIVDTSTGVLSTPVTLTPSTVPVAVATAVNGTNAYAYVAETKSAAPGQVDVVSINSSFAGSLQPPVALNKVGTTDPDPTCIAVTPDSLNSRVYVGLAGTDQFAVINNGSSVTLAGQFNLPDPKTTAPGVLGTSAPAGVVIPPLASLPSTGYRVFFTSVNGTNGEVDIIDDNGGTPQADATTLTNFGTSSTPQGIANIPVPTAP